MLVVISLLRTSRSTRNEVMTSTGPDVPRVFLGEKSLLDQDANVHVALTYDVLDASTHIKRVKSPKAGAVVLFAGPSMLIPSLIVAL